MIVLERNFKNWIKIQNLLLSHNIRYYWDKLRKMMFKALPINRKINAGDVYVGECHRYYQTNNTVGGPRSYRIRINRVEELNGKFNYTSEGLFMEPDGSTKMKTIKGSKDAKISLLIEEINLGYLTKEERE